MTPISAKSAEKVRKKKMIYPDFKLPVDDKNAAEFWLDEWDRRFRETKDYAFKESADEMRKYISDHFPDEEDEW